VRAMGFELPLVTKKLIYIFQYLSKSGLFSLNINKVIKQDNGQGKAYDYKYNGEPFTV
jgi:hypothetical protein